MGENGRGSIISISKKQKLNTKISTEAELIGADDVMPQMLWTRYLLESQGYGIDENILYQDNMSAMLLEKNGEKSSTKNMKHINVRYYCIKYQVETRDVLIKHCPKEKMLGGNFTKPFQDALFRKFRAEIMNVPDDLDMVKMGMDGKGFKKGITLKLHNETDHGCPQECVGDCGKVVRKNCANECPDRGTHNSMYNAVILEKVERSRVVRSYADVTRKYVKIPLGQNILIIS